MEHEGEIDIEKYVLGVSSKVLWERKNTKLQG